MEYNVVGFEFCEQKIQDVLKAIETIKPVVNLIKDSYKSHERLEDIHEEGIEINGKIEAYSEILKLKPNKTLTKRLESKIEELQMVIKNNFQENIKIEEYLAKVEEDMVEYFKYILSFDWLNVQILAEIISRIKDDYLTFLAMLLLFTNESIKEEERGEILKHLFESYVFPRELHHAIKSRLLGEEDAIIDYIAITEE